MAVSPEQLREAMARFATGVMVITTASADGHLHGTTASAFTSVSLDPQLILVSMAHKRNTHVHIQTGGRFGVNILAQGQAEIAQYFALDDKIQDKLETVWRLKEGGSPRVEEALVFLECSVVACHSYGDSTIFIAEVEEANVQAGRPLLFYEGQL